ncbi:hypothetical protein SOVF_111800 isoform A [Spinacia oleracea]|uniref:WRKY transcription factor 8 isoform X2 n=1 Tax=Spinacia oleracea TaxID=3562 RepID=A0A9R0I3T0_SPIOL|nr:WRKY transcription factor 8-like isoform X2 [Spinacia oleracea]KNA13964.1 hypothetical protein SOVF_111800 isoform A [Spinacia oleracea]
MEMLNQGLMEGLSSSQIGFYLNSTNLNNYSPPPLGTNHHHHQQQQQSDDLKPLNHNHSNYYLQSSFTLDHVTSTLTKAASREDDYLSVNYNLWSAAWGEGTKGLFQLGGSKRSCNGEDDYPNYVGVSAVKMKKIKGRRKVREPRFCFKTMSDVDVLDDGYKWRKYGQKVVKNTLHPRSYYRCTQDNCRVKKRVERLAEDPRMVITSYEGRHVHSPSNDLDESQGGTQPQLNNFFW